MSRKIFVLLLALAVSPALATLYSYTPSTFTALQALAYSGTAFADGDIIELAPGTYNVPYYAPATAANIGFWFKNRAAPNAKLTFRGQAGTAYPILKFQAGVAYGVYLTDQPGVQWTLQHLHLQGINDGTASTTNVRTVSSALEQITRQPGLCVFKVVTMLHTTVSSVCHSFSGADAR